VWLEEVDYVRERSVVGIGGRCLVGWEDHSFVCSQCSMRIFMIERLLSKSKRLEIYSR
jgi:hypothetical protein